MMSSWLWTPLTQRVSSMYNATWFFFKISALYKSFTYLLTYLHCRLAKWWPWERTRASQRNGGDHWRARCDNIHAIIFNRVH